MFYKEESKDTSRAVVVLTPSESKRLIARAVVKMTEVTSAFKRGRIIIIGSTSNGFIVEELTGKRKERNGRSIYGCGGPESYSSLSHI